MAVQRYKPPKKLFLLEIHNPGHPRLIVGVTPSREQIEDWTMIYEADRFGLPEIVITELTLRPSGSWLSDRAIAISKPRLPPEDSI